MEEEKTVMDDMLEQISLTSETLRTADDTDVRVKETKNYDTQVRTMMEYEKQTASMTYQYDKLEAESKFEAMRLEIEKKKVDNEIATMWADIALKGLGLGLTTWTGILYLKANLKYGGMQGKDAMSIFKDLKHFKLR